MGSTKAVARGVQKKTAQIQFLAPGLLDVHSGFGRIYVMKHQKIGARTDQPPAQGKITLPAISVLSMSLLLSRIFLLSVIEISKVGH
jgi:hypothetical protein